MDTLNSPNGLVEDMELYEPICVIGIDLRLFDFGPALYVTWWRGPKWQKPETTWQSWRGIARDYGKLDFMVRWV